MLKCNTCKNPIAVSSIHCEWCGVKVVRETPTNIDGKPSTTSIEELMNKLNLVDDEIIKESSSAGAWGALDGILTRAFGNTKIDSLNQKKATIIQTFPLPKNANELLEIANMAVSNFKNIKIHKVALTDHTRNENKINQPIKNAWKTKAEQAINLLNIYAGTDEIIRQQIGFLNSQLIEENKGWFK